jgi:hypothetical protein
MLNWTLPIGWILLLFEGSTNNATCRDADGNIIVVDLLGV